MPRSPDKDFEANESEVGSNGPIDQIEVIRYK
jgi:hypothetical protein